MSVTVERVREVIVPLLADLDVELYDVDHIGGSLRVTLDRPGGIDVEAITRATRAISAALDEADVVPNAYTLEVSSPGIERQLRTATHFRGAVGEEIKIKTRAGVEGDRRIEGRLRSVDDDQLTVDAPDGSTRTVSIDDVDRAHTVHDWSPTPKPGKQKNPSKKNPSTPTNQHATDPAAPAAPPSTSTNPSNSEATQ